VSYLALNIPSEDRIEWYRPRGPSPATPGTLLMWQSYVIWMCPRPFSNFVLSTFGCGPEVSVSRQTIPTPDSIFLKVRTESGPIFLVVIFERVVWACRFQCVESKNENEFFWASQSYLCKFGSKRLSHNSVNDKFGVSVISMQTLVQASQSSQSQQ